MVADSKMEKNLVHNVTVTRLVSQPKNTFTDNYRAYILHGEILVSVFHRCHS